MERSKEKKTCHLGSKHSKCGNSHLPICFRDTLIPVKFYEREMNVIEKETRNEVIRVRVTAREKEKIERLAKRRKLNISEYLRQNAIGKSNEERSERWYSVLESLEKICSLCDGEAKVQLMELLRELYAGGA